MGWQFSALMLSLYSQRITLKLRLEPVCIYQYSQRYNFGKTNRWKIFGNIIPISKFENSIKIFQFEDINASSKSEKKNHANNHNPCLHCLQLCFRNFFIEIFKKNALYAVTKRANRQGVPNQKEIQQSLWHFFSFNI